MRVASFEVKNILTFFIALPILVILIFISFLYPVMSIAALVSLITGILCFISYPFVVLLAIIGMVPIDSFNSSLTGNNNLSIVKIMFIPLLFVVLLKKTLHAESYVWVKQATVIFIFLIVIVFSAMFAENIFYSMRALRKYVGVISLYFLTLQFITSWKRLKIVLWTIILTCTFSSLMSLIQVVTGASSILGASGFFDTPDEKIGLSNVDPNTYATQLLTALLLSISFFFDSNKPKTRFFLLSISICLFTSFVLTYSRGTSIALLFGILLFIIFYWKKLNPAYFIGIILIGFCGLFFIPTEYWERLATLGEIKADISLLRRISYHVLGIKLIMTHPFVGVGPGNFPEYYVHPVYRYIADTFSGGRFLHNMFLSVMVDTGIIGFSLFVTTMALAYLSIFRVYRKSLLQQDKNAEGISKAMIIAFTSFIFSNLFLPAEYFKYLWLFFALASSAELLQKGYFDEKKVT